MKIRNLQEFKTKVFSTPDLREEFIKDPIAFINRLETNHPIWNKNIFITIVAFVGIALFASIIVAGITVLKPGTIVEDPSGVPILLKNEIDNFFVMIASSSIGALTGMLIPSPKEQ